MAGGSSLDDNELAADAFREAGIGNNSLGVAHTMRNFESANHRAELTDTGLSEQWTVNGGKDMQQRTHEQWTQILARYEAPPFDLGVDEELKAFTHMRKASMARCLALISPCARDNLRRYPAWLAVVNSERVHRKMA